MKKRGTVKIKIKGKVPKSVLYDVIVVGGGPAGLTAASNTALRGLKTLLIEADKKTGGKPHQFYSEKCVFDHPGFPEGITGEEIGHRLWQHAHKNKVTIHKHEQMTNLEVKNTVKTIRTSKGSYKAKAVIVCTGLLSIPRRLPSLENYKGKGVHYVIRVPKHYKKKNILIVGNGNNAFDNANMLAKCAKSVTIISRKNTVSAKPSSIKLAKKNKVNILYNTELEKLTDGGRMHKAYLKNNKTKKQTILKTNAIIINIGFLSAQQFLKELGMKLDKTGAIKVDQHMQSSIKGVFAAGDVAGQLNLISIACSSGITAALGVFKYLKKDFVLRVHKETKVC